MSEQRRLLLDTHIWFWLVTANRRKLKAASINKLSATAEHSKLLVSVISAWEIAMLETKGRLGLGVPVQAWVTTACAQPEFELTGLSVPLALDSVSLPGQFHSDPADRFLVATARTQQATLVTYDEKIIAYAKAGHVNVLGVAT